METVFVALLAFVAAAGLSWVVLSPSIHEGLLVKMGLVLMIFALLGIAGASAEGSPPDAYGNALALWLIGGAMAGFGALLRFKKGGRRGVR